MIRTKSEVSYLGCDLALAVGGHDIQPPSRIHTMMRMMMMMLEGPFVGDEVLRSLG
jgi:hypothetical protein